MMSIKDKNFLIATTQARIMQSVDDMGGTAATAEKLKQRGFDLKDLAQDTEGLTLGEAIQDVAQGYAEPDKVLQIHDDFRILHLLGDPVLLAAEAEVNETAAPLEQPTSSNSANGSSAASPNQSLDIRATPNSNKPDINAYTDVAKGPQGEEGKTLKQNKVAILEVLDELQASPAEKRLIMALGMLETQHLDALEHDGKKDGKESANFSAFNLTAALLKMTGFNGDPQTLNDPKNLPAVLQCMLNGVRGKGDGGSMDTATFLNAIRGGTYDVGSKMDVPHNVDYRNGIATIEEQLRLDPSLLSDDRRVEVSVPYI